MAAPEPSASSPQPPPRRHARTISLTLEGALGPVDVPGLFERLRQQLDPDESHMVACDVGRLAEIDIATVDALARFALAARRLRCRVIFLRASPELQDLLALAGMSRVLPCYPLPVETVGQPEHREEPRGVEEERDPGDAVT